MQNHPFEQFLRDDGVSIPYDNLVAYNENSQLASREFTSNGISGLIEYTIRNGKLYVTLAGNVKDGSRELKYLAASPMTRGYSYAGSGLPFPNPEMAYDSKMSMGSVPIDNDGDFTFTIEYPNSYYVRQGRILLNPHVHLYSDASEQVHTIELGSRLPNRSLTGLSDRYDRSTRR